jgi:hypothetical protein
LRAFGICALPDEEDARESLLDESNHTMPGESCRTVSITCSIIRRGGDVEVNALSQAVGTQFKQPGAFLARYIKDFKPSERYWQICSKSSISDTGPPTQMTEPATIPPPITRSNSPTPFIRWLSWKRTRSGCGSGFADADLRLAAAPAGVRSGPPPSANSIPRNPGTDHTISPFHSAMLQKTRFYFL